MNFSQRQIGFWLSLVLVFGFLFYLLKGMLAPFLAGFALAYILDPVVDLLERIYIPRLLATFIAVLLAIGFVIGLFLLLLPILLSQLSSVIESFPSYIEWVRALILEFAPSLKELVKDVPAIIENAEGSFPSALLKNILISIGSGGIALISFLSFLIITPIVTTYILRDWDGIISYIDGLLPSKKAARIREVVRKIDEALSASLRGLFTVCLVLGVFYGTSLHLLGLNFGLLIGIFSGLISFIPYAGVIFGFLLAFQAALFQFWDNWQWALLICGSVFGVGQILESYVLTPKLVGDKVGIPAVWIIFALMAFGALGGFAGLLIALPSAAIIAVLLRHGVQLYQESDYYNK